MLRELVMVKAAQKIEMVTGLDPQQILGEVLDRCQTSITRASTIVSSEIREKFEQQAELASEVIAKSAKADNVCSLEQVGQLMLRFDNKVANLIGENTLKLAAECQKRYKSEAAATAEQETVSA